jgi:hypothetical protein
VSDGFKGPSELHVQCSVWGLRMADSTYKEQFIETIESDGQSYNPVAFGALKKCN